MTAEELVGMNKKEMLRAKIESIRLSDVMDEEFVTVRPDDRLGDVLARMTELDLHEIPVSKDGKRIEGLVSYGTMLRRKNLSTEAKASTIMVSPPNVPPDAAITEVAEILLREGYRQLPIVEDGRIAGVVSRSHILSVVKNVQDVQDVPVESIMTTDARTVGGKDRVVDAVTTMRNLDIRIMPVVDDPGRIMGIVGIKDIANYNWREKRRQTIGEVVGNSYPADVLVESVMIEEPVTIPPGTTVGEAAGIMLDRRISTLPVVDDRELLGVVTTFDLVELVASFRRRDMMYMQITGLENEDRFESEQMERIITQSMQKIARIIPPLMFSLHVGKYKQEGLRTKYSLNGRLVTIDGVMNSNSSQWDLIQATADLMAIFERRVIERKEEKLEHRRRSRNIGHR
ncbi:MAG TPA: CBS domain-containing protein [Methanomassiliicoccaceae archaeon]|jgi:CBS domain-containing protein|nr:CBS domain-containing protein [Methanomassiliicoccaceae archaeon]HQA20805.1 CBS domain-containing protein [Methanomassiliicoccaceae archaeon]HQD87890.1 CBS domain-containing protein [Methanomassiliicoccaceae archaeon]